jgi:hypothetical protein
MSVSFTNIHVGISLAPTHSNRVVLGSVFVSEENTGGSELLGPYSPISWDVYPRLPNHLAMVGADVKGALMAAFLFKNALE